MAEVCVGLVMVMDGDQPQPIWCSGSSEDGLGFHVNVDIVVVEEVNFCGGENFSAVGVTSLAY